MTRQAETNLLRRLMLRVSERGARVCRNDNGVGYREDGSRFSYGLGPGTSDAVGMVSALVTPEMVGRRLAVALVIETKGTAKTRTSDKQRAFLRCVADAGGLAIKAREIDGVLRLIEAAQRGEIGWLGRVHRVVPGP